MNISLSRLGKELPSTTDDTGDRARVLNSLPMEEASTSKQERHPHLAHLTFLDSDAPRLDGSPKSIKLVRSWSP